MSAHGRLLTDKNVSQLPPRRCPSTDGHGRQQCSVRSRSRSGQGVTGDPPEIRIWVRGHAVRLIPNRPQITKLKGGPHHD